jgi:hypothetical protein
MSLHFSGVGGKKKTPACSAGVFLGFEDLMFGGKPPGH